MKGKDRIHGPFSREKVCSSSIAVVLSVTTVGCGKATEQDYNTDINEQYVYVPEFIDLNFSEDSYQQNLTVIGEEIYYLEYEWNEVTQVSSTVLYHRILESQEASKINLTLEENESVIQFLVDSENNIILITNLYGGYNMETGVEGENNFFIKKIDLQEKIVEFNKASEQYRIKIQSYYDINSTSQSAWNDEITALNNAITSDNCPDILDLSQLNVSAYASKGLIEDLGNYLDNSETLSREDFVPRVLEAYTLNGSLVCIPNAGTYVWRTNDLYWISNSRWTVRNPDSGRRFIWNCF